MIIMRLQNGDQNTSLYELRRWYFGS